MTRRPRPQKRKRQRVEPKVHRDRLRPCRVFRVEPEPGRPFVVEVRIAKHRRAMRDEMSYHEGAAFAAEVELECMGLVRTWWGKRTRCSAVIRPRGIVARMFLNVRDLRARPSEIIAHECTHAAMGWARLQRAQLGWMAGEEVLAYAVGRLVKQVNRVCYAHGVW